MRFNQRPHFLGFGAQLLGVSVNVRAHLARSCAPLQSQAKVASVLGTAAAFGHKSLVLGAWGCGAFGNPPEVVSRAFATQLRSPAFDGAFERVIFAIPDDELRQAFDSAFAAAS